MPVFEIQRLQLIISCRNPMAHMACHTSALLEDPVENKKTNDAHAIEDAPNWMRLRTFHWRRHGYGHEMIEKEIRTRKSCLSPKSRRRPDLYIGYRLCLKMGKKTNSQNCALKKMRRLRNQLWISDEFIFNQTQITFSFNTVITACRTESLKWKKSLAARSQGSTKTHP